MILYFAGNVGNQKYKESCMILGNAENQLISYNDILTKNANMNLYFAGAEVWHQVLDDIQVTKQLASYHYMTDFNDKKKDAVFNRHRNIFIDSGGFSAFTQGVKINIDDYCDFIKKYKKQITYYAQLDVIGDEQGTERNQKYMESQGLNPLPVFHFKGDYKRLEALVKEYDYICLGGLVPLSRAKPILIAHLDKCFSIIKDNCKVHGFGMTGMDILKRYPWYSVDSTSWIEASRRGTHYEFKNGKMNMLSTSDKKKATYKSIGFSGKQKGLWRLRLIHSIKEWLKLEIYINELWNKKLNK
tara:strand:- start:612 stop:1511 length:900 start_codon:yes stop_codon:yes gene_type:complete